MMRYFLTIAFFLISFIGFAQRKTETIKLHSFDELAKRLGISSDQAKTYFTIIEQSTLSANIVYGDSLLSDSLKRIKLNIIYEDKQKRIEALFPNGLKRASKPTN